MENETIKIIKHGEEVEFEVLFTFESEDTNKAYIGYTDNSFNANGRKNIYVSSFDPIVGTGKLEDITDPDELAMVNEVLETIASEEIEEI